MLRISAALAMVAVLTAATPSFSQDAPNPGFGALIGGLVGVAIDAATAGRRPRGGDFVPGGGSSGKSAGKAGGSGQHREVQGGSAAGHRTTQLSAGGQIHRKQGK